ncbi:hypothetical protein R6Q57_026200 [Mikania cordata]
MGIFVPPLKELQARGTNQSVWSRILPSSTYITTPAPPLTTFPPYHHRLLPYQPSTQNNSELSFHNATVCDGENPFRHLLSLRLTNCSGDLTLSTTALASLSTLTSLTFSDCHVPIVHFSATLSNNLRSFTSINSLQQLTCVFLSRFGNLTDLTISGDTIKAFGISILFGDALCPTFVLNTKSSCSTSFAPVVLTLTTSISSGQFESDRVGLC